MNDVDTKSRTKVKPKIERPRLHKVILNTAAGVKFNDADLLGLPVRLVMSPRNLNQGAVEVKGRREEKARLVSTGDVVETVKRMLE